MPQGSTTWASFGWDPGDPTRTAEEIDAERAAGRERLAELIAMGQWLDSRSGYDPACDGGRSG